MHTHVTQNNGEYRDVPVTALTESASNPRKRFDENSLSELAGSEFQDARRSRSALGA